MHRSATTYRLSAARVLFSLLLALALPVAGHLCLAMMEMPASMKHMTGKHAPCQAPQAPQMDCCHIEASALTSSEATVRAHRVLDGLSAARLPVVADLSPPAEVLSAPPAASATAHPPPLGLHLLHAALLI